MSSRLVSRVVLAGLLLLGAAGLRVAFANADSLDALQAQILLPSDTPGLLGPINESGRTGWECKPEIAASSSGARMAELPQAPNR